MTDYPPIEVEGETINVTEDMIFGGSLACQTCTLINDYAVMVAGTLYWVCDNGHGSKVVLYE
jgi:hypothetical protein